MLQLTLFSDNPSGSPFDSIKRIDEQGNECWFGRELGDLLGYNDWRNFKATIVKAGVALEVAGYNVSDHIVKTTNMIGTGKGAKRKVEDFKLSRLACYHTAQEGDASKPIVAAAKNYFVIQVRKQEVADEKKRLESHKQAVTGYELKGKSHDWAESRVDAKESHKRLAAALQKTHTEHKPDYGRIGATQNQELFEMTKREIVEYLGLLPSQETNYRDYLGKYAHEAIRMSNTVIVDKMNDLGRELTTDEQLQIIRDVTRRIAPTMRELAEYANVDYISGAKKDRHGKALISRNVKLLNSGK